MKRHSRVSATGRSCTKNFFKVQYIIIQAVLGRKSMKKFAATDEKYSVSARLLTVKYNSHANIYEDFPCTAFEQRLPAWRGRLQN